MKPSQPRSTFQEKHCRPCEGGALPLAGSEAIQMLHQLEGWALEGKSIVKTFQFKNFHQTMAFVNAVAWIAHQEGHHPDLNVGYKHCRVSYTTHIIDGLSENDFICAAKVDGLLG